MTKFQQFVFYALVLLFPLNLGKHFVLSSSYINGFLIDYLVPTIFLSDILILLLLGSWWLEKPSFLFRPAHFLKAQNLFPLLFLVLLFPSVLVSANRIAAFYKLFKYAEFISLGIFISRKFDLSLLGRVFFCLSLSVLFESLLSVGQWLKQGYIFGYLPFGEVSIVPRPPYALVSFLGSFKLRVYGTFPHPNVLGGYLSLVLPSILFYSRKFVSSRRQGIFYDLVFVLGSVTLFLTFSRTAWISFLIGLILVTVLARPRLFRDWSQPILVVTLITVLGSVYVLGSLDDSPLSINRRLELASVALTMFQSQPWAGVGLNNFTSRLEDFSFISGSSRFIQPVHNIYLLVLSETGIFGLLSFLILFIPPLLKCFPLVHPPRRGWSYVFIPLSQLALIGLFDHYWLTIQPGLIIFWVVWGSLLCLTSFEPVLPQVENLPRMKE